MALSWNKNQQQEDQGDAPFPPPSSVAEAIPPFHLHGERCCGDHRHSLDNKNFRAYLETQHRGHSSTWLVACSNCQTRTTLNQLHDLPCGEMICRSCVVGRTTRARRELERNHVRIQNNRAKMSEIEQALAGSPGMHPRQRRALARRQSELGRAVMRLAGLTCCGVDMKLERFLACMAPDVSRDLWLVCHWLRDPVATQRSCAWPDCGAYLPRCCRYEVAWCSVRRYYCVACDGNSMDCSRALPAAQTRFPWLPRGHPALTPAR